MYHAMKWEIKGNRQTVRVKGMIKAGGVTQIWH